MSIVEILREKAKGYELNALSQRERGKPTAAEDFAAVACALHEVADAFDKAFDATGTDGTETRAA